MKRLTLWLLAAAVGLPSAIQAQGLTMQMSNGWKFTFSGNVNAFAVYSADANGGRKNFNIRTGLLPGFAVFDARGKEGNYDLGVHVGFAPEIQSPGQVHDALAQIDMRQLYLTVGFRSGGQLLAGREIGLFGRQNIINDMTLYGTGALGGVQGGGITLGRIGYGYLYPAFNAQITYSSAAGRPTQFSVGLFQPSVYAGHTETELPRVEAEVTHSTKMSGRNANLWVGGEWQTTKTAPSGGTSLSSIGLAAGVRVDLTAQVNLTVAGYYTKGVGTALQFDGLAFADATHTRPDLGGYVQLMYKIDPNSWLGGSWGISELKGAGTASADASSHSLAHRASYTVGYYHNMTRSLKAVLEGTREINRYFGGANRTDVSAGLMLFF
jgi:hypothetical protein